MSGIRCEAVTNLLAAESTTTATCQWVSNETLTEEQAKEAGDLAARYHAVLQSIIADAPGGVRDLTQ